MDAREHKAALRRLFDAIAPLYDSPANRFLPFCADRLVSYVRPRPGSKVLDVATGSGAAAIAFAQAVAPAGRVAAIDLSPAMLERAAANIRKMALDNVDLHQMDAEQLEFRGGYFHVVVCCYALTLLPDMPAALREWVRVLRPGGRLAFTSFAAGAFQPMLDDLLARLQAFGARPAEALPGTGRLQSEEQCRQLLAAAGLSQIDAQTIQLGYHLRDADDWWEVISSSALRGLIEQLPPDRQAVLRAEHLGRVAAWRTVQGLWLDVETCFASGVKPRS